MVVGSLWCLTPLYITLLQLFYKVHFLLQKMSLNRRNRFLGIYNVLRILKFDYWGIKLHFISLPGLLNVIILVLEVLTFIHHSLQNLSTQSSLAGKHSGELDNRMTSSAYNRQSIIWVIRYRNSLPIASSRFTHFFFFGRVRVAHLLSIFIVLRLLLN